jgi:deoxyribose-phosphate aldolase
MSGGRTTGAAAGEPVTRLIDHALLHPTLTDDELAAGCHTARRLGVASVCVKPYAVALACRLLRGSSVAVGTVVGFPHGSSATPVKVAEAEWACAEGARELDMVVNIGKVLSGDWAYVEDEIRAIVEVGRRWKALVKVIFETDYVTRRDDKFRLCEVSARAGADFVKTSTGFGFVKLPTGDYNYAGATEDDVRLMRESCPPHVGVKASGGIRHAAQARRMVALGASRLGTSASEAIAAEAEDPTSY